MLFQKDQRAVNDKVAAMISTVNGAFRPVSKVDDEEMMLKDIMALLKTMGTHNTCRD